MRKPFFIAICFLFLFSCNGDSPINNNMPDPNDTTGMVTKKTDPIKPRSDSFEFDQTKSSFACTRTKTVKDVDKQIKIFGGSMNLKMDNASFSASTNIKIKNGWWFFLDKKPDGVK